MNFAEYIEQFKAEMGLDDRDIARIMDVGPMTFKNYLTGYIPPPATAMQRLVSTLALKHEDGALSPPNEKLPFRTFDPDELIHRAADGALGFEIKDNGLAKEKLYHGSVALIRRCTQPANGDILCLSIDGGDRCLKIFSDMGEKVRIYDDNSERILSREEFTARVSVIGRVTGSAENPEN